MPNPVERADRVSRARALFAPFAAAALLSVQQWLFFSREWEDVSVLQLGAWAVLALLALFFLLTGGLWFVPRKVRELAEEESTEKNRQLAIRIGFIVAIFTSFLVFGVSPFEPLPAQRAAHIISSMSLGTALIAFGMAELRSLD